MKHHDQVSLDFQFKKEQFLAEQYKDLLDDLLDPQATLPPGGINPSDSSPEELQSEFETISREVRGLVDAVNGAVNSAQDLQDKDTRNLEIAAARAKITELQAITASHPSVELQRLEEVEALIEQIDQETPSL
jgi:hypothetical protein